MNDKTISWLVSTVTAMLSLIILGWWLSHDPGKDFVESVPGMDNRPAGSAILDAGGLIDIGEHWQAFDGSGADLPGAWPRFRGSNFDNISPEQTKLADNWDESGPDILWSVDLGEGHAAPAVSNGRVYLLDYDEEKKADALRCFSLADGKEIWRRWYNVRVKRNHGMSRTVPAVSDSFVVTMGPRCHVMCVEADSGSFRWGLDLAKDFGTEVPLWYTGQCPLIDDSLAVIAPGGKALMIGVHLRTGEIVWQTPNPNGWQMSHSSIMPMALKGRQMYVYCAIGGMIGVSAEGEDRGTVLWQTRLFNPAVIAPSPMILHDGRILVSAGYGAGSMMLQVVEENGEFAVNSLQTVSPKDGLASEQ
ncbi:MAG: PQQ-binding-like beta-propeller repeat protein, partial [Planctomycetes bacterium]|nr:PQQ-binding-like beta-propeller repeat protein [Planctomycetota bacterium]